jgi:hypothetical protein
VQINGQTKGKSTIGGILVKGDMSPKRVIIFPNYRLRKFAENISPRLQIKKELVRSVMHPGRDRHGPEFLRKYNPKSGKAPTDSKGKKPTNEQARKRTKARNPKLNPKSRRMRKLAKKNA